MKCLCLLDGGFICVWHDGWRPSFAAGDLVGCVLVSCMYGFVGWRDGWDCPGMSIMLMECVRVSYGIEFITESCSSDAVVNLSVS